MPDDLAAVEFRLLGPFAIHYRGSPIDHALTGPPSKLLIYLLANAERRHRRECLVEMIWPEQRAPSRGTFNTTLWRLKKFLEGLPGPRLEARPDTLRLTLGANCTVDSAMLRTAVARVGIIDQALPEETASALHLAVACWRGPFAEGQDSDWVLAARERVHNDYIRALTALMRDAGTSRRYGTALDYGCRILKEDPFIESVHCEVMWLCVLMGQRVKAINRHRQFRALLRRELDIGPMAETTALFDFISYGLEEPPGPTAELDRCTTVHHYESFLSAVGKSRAVVYDALRTMNCGVG